MSTISTFKSRMAGGGARPNQFRVFLNFPAAAGNLGAAAGEAAQFLCYSATLPGSIITDIPVMYRGRPVHFAGEREFQPWAVDIYNDNDFLVRNALETWSNSIVNYDATNGILAPSDYQAGQMTVEQLDRNDNPVKQYIFYDVYPTDVGQIQLSFEQNNDIEKFSTTFVYNYFTASDI